MTSLPPSLPKAYIYTRRSTITQDTTHESQERDCRAWAKHNGYQVAGVSYDDCSGSTPVDQREGFIHIVSQIKHDEVLLIKCRDRLGRDVSVNTVAESIINRIGARVVSIELGDTDTPEGQLIKGIMDQFAQFELALIRQRTKRALELRKSKGLVTGKAPLGMCVGEDGKLIEDLEEMRWLERARTLRLEGLLLTEVHKVLIEEGCLARSGEAPSLSTVCRWCKGLKIPKQPRRRHPRVQRLKGGTLVSEKILALSEAGLSLREISRNLQKYPEVKTSKGKPLNHTQVARILKRERLRRDKELEINV